MEGPPTTTMYSPLAARALPVTPTKSKSNKEKRRIPPISRSTIYAQREAAQGAAKIDYREQRHHRCQLQFFVHQILPGLASPNQRDLVAVNQCFRWQGTRIVIRRHHKSVSTRAHNRQQILFMQFWHLPSECEKIALFAHRPDNVDFSNLPLPLTLRLLHRYDLVI